MKTTNWRPPLLGQFHNGSLRRLWLVFALGIWLRAAFPAEIAAQVINAQAQERISQLLQNALGAIRSDFDTKTGATNNSWWNLTNIEASFREASTLMPSRLDLRFGIASTLILEAIHTNSQFNPKIKDALRVYREIHSLDTNGFEAPILYAAYSRAIGEFDSSEATINQLLSVHPLRTQEYLDKFCRADEILQMAPNQTPQITMPTNRDHAIVVLGAALETNGTIKAKLFGRLQQGLRLARIYPEAPIILTGGNPKSGITEAYAMSLWFLNEGVPGERLYLEDQAKDTVGNAVFSCAILQKLGATHVTLVTSANHIRRGLADLEEACLQHGLVLNYAILSAEGEPELDPERERVAIYRDVMRTSGLWAFPGIQR